jgi:hypothetical protein
MHVGIAADHGGFELKEDLAVNKVALLEREPARTSR